MIQFASYLRRVLCKTRLIFPRINGPIVQVVRLSYYNFFFVTVRHNFMIFFNIYTAVKPRILLESVNINDFVNRWKKMTVCDK